MTGGIRLAEHDPAWARAAEDEIAAIMLALAGFEIRLHHIGSTSVPGLVAKPILDLLLETSDLPGLDGRSTDLAALGYEAMGAFGIDGRLYFRKSDGAGRGGGPTICMPLPQGRTMRCAIWRFATFCGPTQSAPLPMGS